MTDYLNVNELAESAIFRGRIRAAIAVKAAAVLGEEGGRPRIRAKRRELAASVIADPAPHVNGFVWLVVTNGDVRAKGHAIDDDALGWVVGWAWDQVAGVTETDRADPEPAQ